jgi:hypothetical protein
MVMLDQMNGGFTGLLKLSGLKHSVNPFQLCHLAKKEFITFLEASVSEGVP